MLGARLCRVARSRVGVWLSPNLLSPLQITVVPVRHLAKGKKGKGGKSKGSAEVQEEADTSGGAAKLDEESLKQQLGKPLEQLQREFAGMQTGRAAPSLLDSVLVDVGEAGGGQLPLPSLAKVLAQGPQALQVACYDAAHVPATVAAIERSPLELRAEQQGKLIKVAVPRPTKESREQLAKHARNLAEAARVSVRGVRQRGMKTAKSEATKEEVKRSEKKVEGAAQAAVAAIDAAVKAKEKDIMTV
jgi:ribosome recycling factor